MDISWAILFAVVFVVSIQSIFGVGMLLLGTPMLIVCGLEYQEALSYLLPSSILISAAQIFSSREVKLDKIAFFCIYGLPPVAIGISIYFLEFTSYKITPFIGCMLILSALIRISKKLLFFLKKIADHNEKSFVVLIGLLHGYSNMGGALLTVWASFKYDSKEVIRGVIAQGYIIFAATQLVMLFLVGNFYLSIYSALIPLLSIATYITIGRGSFKAINQNYFNNLLSVLMLFFGILLIIRSL